jgi:CheY-like chemotaxis protein
VLLTEIKKDGERASGLVEQLLAFSRKRILQPQVLDLNALIAEVEKMLRRLIGEDIQLAVQASADLHRVKADPSQIQQVLMNLAVNARDAMPHGGKLIIATRNVPPGERHGPLTAGHAHNMVELTMTDTGCGMTPDILAHIFEPFFTTKEQGKGTGLGLATVYGIVAQSGGSIDVHSEPGEGTTFRVFLPRTSGSISEMHGGRRPPALPHGNETILLVEDDEAVRRLAGLVLRNAGYTVFEARTGMEAIALLDSSPRPVHLMLTDVVMPEMSGRSLADVFDQKSPSTKVLYMSGYLDDTIVRHGILECGLAFLHKPFTAAGLLEKVREVLDGVSQPGHALLPQRP